MKHRRTVSIEELSTVSTPSGHRQRREQTREMRSKSHDSYTSVPAVHRRHSPLVIIVRVLRARVKRRAPDARGRDRRAPATPSVPKPHVPAESCSAAGESVEATPVVVVLDRCVHNVRCLLCAFIISLPCRHEHADHSGDESAGRIDLRPALMKALPHTA